MTTREVASDFQLIAGSNRDLREDAHAGRFRADLLARLDMWTFELPGLRERTEDIEANIEFELARYARESMTKAAFNKEAHRAYLKFATCAEATWLGNFRDLGASITRMATLADGARINVELVNAEIKRLARAWSAHGRDASDPLTDVLGRDGAEKLDRFDRVQLADVINVCRRSASLSAAGRELFAVSRAAKRSTNDADRLKKYLERFGLNWGEIGRFSDLTSQRLCIETPAPKVPTPLSG